MKGEPTTDPRHRTPGLAKIRGILINGLHASRCFSSLPEGHRPAHPRLLWSSHHCSGQQCPWARLPALRSAPTSANPPNKRVRLTLLPHFFVSP